MDKCIFISCGQATEEEKTIGVLLKATVDAEAGFRGYFAETVHDLEALSRHVLQGIQECVGAIFVLQDRGLVVRNNGSKWGHRSSVWVNQELAILAYRRFFESREIPVLAFRDANVKLEGAMTALIVNPQPLPSTSQLPAVVRSWLASANFAETSSDAFRSKWEQLTDSARQVIAVLIAEGGKNVKEFLIRQGVSGRFGIDINASDANLRDAKLQFMRTDLVQLIPNIHSGNELSLNPTWEFSLRRQSSAWAAHAGR